jgi:DNA (cytosine-5)-methyltransferase 1
MTLRALDLFCCAGGVGKGLQQAGFDVVGVDIELQWHYPGEFHRGDAMTFPLDGFDFIWASPPCQGYSDLKNMPDAKEHPKLIEAVRERLQASGKPYAIENVEGAPLLNPITLCGSQFRLEVDGFQLRRHRLIETNFFVPQPTCRHTEPVIGVYGGHARCRSAKHGGRGTRDFVGKSQKELASEAMGIDWMTLKEMSQALPPVYSKFIGEWAALAIQTRQTQAA